MVFLFMYSCFCYSIYAIPDSIPYAHAQAFIYIFSMLQLIEVAGFLRGESLRSAVLLVVTLVTGPVLSTIQILLVMQGYNEQWISDAFGYVLIIKEAGSQLMIRDNTSRVPGISLVQSIVVVALWIISETVFRIAGNGIVYESVTTEKFVYIVRMSPHFYMTLITLTRIN
jgi:hypothetical protein